MTELAYSYANIIKQEKLEDGTIKVYGKATDDSVDIDQQICDEGWLTEAMPQWFKTGGNIREQHSSIAAGVATDYEHKTGDGHYIEAHIVDPVSVKKIEAGVLKGFSIGIRGPRVIRDAKATGGRIVGGQIVEVSVVDRPANSNAKMTIAKSVDGELVEVEQAFSERPTPASIAGVMNKGAEDQERDENGRFGSGGGGSNESESGSNSGSSGSDHPATLASQEIDSIGEPLMEIAMSDTETMNGMEQLSQAQEALNSINTDEPIGSNEAYDKADAHLREAQSYFQDSDRDETNRAGEKVEKLRSEIMTGLGKSAIRVEPMATNEVDERVEKATSIVNKAAGLLEELNKYDEATFNDAMDALGNLVSIEAQELTEGHDERESIKHLLKAIKHLIKWYQGEVAEGEVVNPNPNLLGDDMSVMPEMQGEEIELAAKGENPFAKEEDEKPADDKEETEKAIDADEEMCAKCEKSADECKCADKSVAPDLVEATIIEKAVKSAREAVESEIEQLKAVAKSLEAERDEALSKAAAGGPVRSGLKSKISKHETGDLLNKAAEYRAKAASTEDRFLAEGYAELADDLETKARKS